MAPEEIDEFIGIASQADFELVKLKGSAHKTEEVLKEQRALLKRLTEERFDLERQREIGKKNAKALTAVKDILSSEFSCIQRDSHVSPGNMANIKALHPNANYDKVKSLAAENELLQKEKQTLMEEIEDRNRKREIAEKRKKLFIRRQSHINEGLRWAEKFDIVLRSVVLAAKEGADEDKVKNEKLEGRLKEAEDEELSVKMNLIAAEAHSQIESENNRCVALFENFEHRQLEHTRNREILRTWLENRLTQISTEKRDFFQEFQRDEKI